MAPGRCGTVIASALVIASAWLAGGCGESASHGAGSAGTSSGGTPSSAGAGATTGNGGTVSSGGARAGSGGSASVGGTGATSGRADAGRGTGGDVATGGTAGADSNDGGTGTPPAGAGGAIAGTGGTAGGGGTAGMPDFSCPEFGLCYVSCTPPPCVRICRVENTLGTDEEVAQLAALKCEQVDGPLRFEDDVTTVAGLQTIRTVTGHVSINLPLDDVSGLRGLETVEGWISLTDLDASEIDFPALKEVGGDLHLLSFGSAERISLPKLTTVGGDLDIGGTPATEIDLDALEHVQGNVSISWNSNLPTLNELPSLLEAQSLDIYGNEKLPQCEVDAIATRLNLTCGHCTENSAACP